MALNYLLHRHQLSVMQAGYAGSAEARAAHRGLAAGYARRIHDLRTESGAAKVEALRVT
jgi:hypothetical protein